MSLIDLTKNAILINVALFATAALGVWLSGMKLSQYVDEIADRTGIGKAFAGALLLGGATSLPEIATTVTASLSGAAVMAGTNLFGGVVMQIAVLAAVDAILLRGKPLTFFSPKAALLMQGVLLILMIAVAMAALVTGELFAVGGVGFWPVFLAAIYAVGLWVLFRYDGESRWKPAGEVEQPPESAKDLKDSHHAKFAGVSTARIGWRFALAALGVLLFGVFVARSGEAIATQSGIGQGFVGATLVALATSLPEVSTTFSAVRFGAYSMAAANILGTNSIEIALFLPSDIAYRDGPIFDALDPSVGLLGALGIVATCIYLWGILERRDRTIWGMGIDSAIVLTVYLGGMVLFYFL
ncbi:MAG: sodium:calcium symporter [Planctomyces sp.]|nr:sodium:calcium symporter [Planctomyces sp.]